MYASSQTACQRGDLGPQGVCSLQSPCCLWVGIWVGVQVKSPIQLHLAVKVHMVIRSVHACPTSASCNLDFLPPGAQALSWHPDLSSVPFDQGGKSMVREQSERCDSKVSEQSAISVVDSFLISFIFRTKERNMSPTLGQAQRNKPSHGRWDCF